MNTLSRYLLVAGGVVLGLTGLFVSNVNLRNKGGPEVSDSSPARPPSGDNPACDDADTLKSVGQIVADQGVQLLDIAHVQELNFDKNSSVRFCEADATLSTGTTRLSYRIYHGPSGKLLIEAKEGRDAFNAFGLSTEQFSEKQYKLKLDALRNATQDYRASHPDGPPAQPDYEKTPGTTPFGTPYHSGPAQDENQSQPENSNNENSPSDGDSDSRTPHSP